MKTLTEITHDETLVSALRKLVFLDAAEDTAEVAARRAGALYD
jgi:hypothetical protein